MNGGKFVAVGRALRFQILRRDGHACFYCGRKAPDVKLTVDHVVPEALGGSDEPSNLVTACSECNGGKSATPPDAAHVAAVAKDAHRWAEAQKLAVDRIMGRTQEQLEIRERFEKRWTHWTQLRGRRAHLSGDWERSVSTFLSAGLPIEVLLESLDGAMSTKVAADGVFRYMCGIAWARIREIRDATAAIVAEADAGPAEPLTSKSRADADRHFMSGWNEARKELAESILSFFDDEEKARYLALARQSALDEGDELEEDNGTDGEDPYMLGRAAWEVVFDYWGLVEGLRFTIRSFLDCLPKALQERALEQSRTDHVEKAENPNPSQHEIERWAIQLIGYEIRDFGIPKGADQ